MSQTMTRTRVGHSANRTIVDHFEGQLSEVSSGNYRHVLRRALRGLRAHPRPILTKADALTVPSVGPRLAVEIQVLLASRPPSESGPPSQIAEPGAVLLPTLDEHPDPASSPAFAPRAPRRRPRAPARPRTYRPQYRSAAYAVLIALYHAEQSSVPAMRKEELARSAQQHCDKPILTAASEDRSTWYDGWSAVNKTLVPKGLVARGGNPVKFSLSALGRELAETLITTSNDVLDQAVTEYQPGTAAHVGISDLPVLGTRCASASSGAGPSNLRPSRSASLDREIRPQGAANGDGELSRGVQTTPSTSAASPTATQCGAGCRQVPRAVGAVPTATVKKRGRSVASVSARVGRRNLTDAQCERAAKVIQRLESCGYDRSDCIKIVEVLHKEKALPKNADSLYQAVVNVLWEVEKQERGLERGADALDLSISEGNVLNGKSTSDSAECAMRQESLNQSELALTPDPVSSDGIPAILNPHVREATASKEGLTGNVSAAAMPTEVIDLDDDGTCGVRPITAEVKSVEVINIDGEDDEALGVDRDPISEAHDSCKAQPDARRDPEQELQRVLVFQETHRKRIIHPTSALQAPTRTVDEGAVSTKTATECNELQRNAFSHDNPSIPTAAEHQCRVVLLLDSMERFQNSNTRAGHVKSPGELLLEQGVDCEVRQLPTGDALFVARFDEGSEVVLDYIIERKTIEDYAASMRDGRVARQTYLMRHSKVKREVFLLEGDLNDLAENSNRMELRKKLAEMTICSGVYVKQTKDILDTVHFYASLHKRLQKKFVSQTKTAALSDRSLFSDWSERMNIIKKSMTVDQLFAIQLCQIPGVGTAKARAITQSGLNTPYLLYSALKRASCEEEREELLNQGEHAIGTRSSRAIVQVFNLKNYPTTVERTPQK